MGARVKLTPRQGAGTFSEEDLRLALEYMSGGPAETDLTMSRSKGALAYGHD